MVITDSQKTNSCLSVAKLQRQNGIVTAREVKGGESQIVDEYIEFPTLCPIGTSALHGWKGGNQEVASEGNLKSTNPFSLKEGAPP